MFVRICLKKENEVEENSLGLNSTGLKVQVEHQKKLLSDRLEELERELTNLFIYRKSRFYPSLLFPYFFFFVNAR